MRSSLLAVSIVGALTAWNCGGSSANPTSPATPSPASGAAMINILGDKGAQSFSPNPGTVNQGSTVIWQNTDSQTHHIVLNDGSLDTGDIGPGKSSAALALKVNGARYHCTIHPTMVGSINSSTGVPPPCTGLYCD
jgi:plastocyanin